MGDCSRVLVTFTEKTKPLDRVNGHSIATNGGKFCLNGPQMLHGVSTTLLQKLGDCAEFVAGDNSILRELLYPDKQPIRAQLGARAADLHLFGGSGLAQGR